MYIVYILFSFTSLILCQYNWYNHEDLNWHTLETENFLIHFHDETERSARETAIIAEKIYPYLTDLYEYKPSNKTAIIISDYDHGYLLEEDIEFISQNHPLVVMDTKKKLGEYCKDIEFIKINEYEYNQTKHLLSSCSFSFNDKLIVTLSERGCIYKGRPYPVESVEVKDLAGAGDTFLTGFVSEYLKSKNIADAINKGNEYATTIVQHKGINIIGKFL